ncbi:MAG: prolipoprotein diacylglyceryl transferase family protein, partial [Saprospiraceae bacterium]
MKDHLVISVQGSYFFFFYILAFFVALVIMLFDGYKKNFPKLKWTFFLCVTSFFFILGSKIVTYSPEEWRMLLSGFSLPPTHDKSLLGGLLLGVIGIFGASYLFRLKDNFLDTFAIVLPLAIAIQKIGCFLAGCCHGTVTSAPWAVKYQVNTLPHFHHFESGLISDHDILSLPVHPVQLYETILSLIIFGVIIKFRNSFKRNGSLLLLSFILLLLTRFNLEFLRDPLAHTIGGSMYWIFNTTQLVILPIFLILIWILKIRESSKNQTVIFEMQPDLGLVSSISLLFVSSSILWILRSWLSISEIFVLGMHLFAVVSLVGYRLVRNYYASQYKWLYLSSLIFPIILMSQTLPEKGTDSVLANTYKSISFGFAGGNYANSQNIGTGEGCDRISNTQYFKQKYFMAGGGFSINKDIPSLNEQISYGLNAYVGSHTERNLNYTDEKSSLLFGFSPYATYDSKWAGLGGGFHVGNLSYT